MRKTNPMKDSPKRADFKEVEPAAIIFNEKRKPVKAHVANHPTFGLAGGKFCTGPPGRSRSPGIVEILFPDHPPNNKADPDTSPLSDFSEGQGVSQYQIKIYHKEYQTVMNNYKKNNLLKSLNFKIMKKQILILAFFVLALVAANLNSYGQLAPGITATQPIVPITCETAATPLHPVPGVPFTYQMTNGTGATSANWTWWATKDPTFINGTTQALNLGTQLTVASGALIATGTSANYGVDNTAGTNVAENSVSINWSAATLAGTDYQGLPGPGTPTFVVGYSKGVAGCSDNIQVFEINPMPNFTIDIAAKDAGGATLGWDVNTEERCVDIVRSATYAAGAITVDYGTNTIYYEVAAKNFVNNFSPSFMIMGGLNTDQTAVISIYSSYGNATTSTSPLWTSALINAGGMNSLINSNTDLNATNPVDIPNGVSFFVKVVIDNNTEESLADNPFILAVDAVDNVDGTTGLPTTASVWDMEDEDCAGGTVDADDDQVDRSTITINPRPTLQMDGGAMSEPSGANPEDVINKLP